jgi:hypothetical protein
MTSLRDESISLTDNEQRTADKRPSFAYNQRMTDERERLTAMVKAAG